MLIGRKTVLLSLSVIIHAWAFSQNPCTGNFSGRVLSSSGEALVGATILLSPDLHFPRQLSGLREGKQAGQISDREGYFHFVNLCEGTYRVICQYLGFKNQEFDLDIRGNVEQTLRLEQDLKKLEVVVVHGQTEHVENAQNYVRLSEKQLAESAGKTLGESLKDIPGVNTIQAGPGIFKPVIHGVHSQRVLILNHGIRQEGQQWGAEHAPEIDPFIAAEMVVIKDASAIKYGSDALGGVIIVNPPPLPEKPGLGGSYNAVLQSNGRSGTVSGALEGGIKHHDGWGWRMQGTAKRAGDFHTAQYMLTNTGLQEIDFSASAGYHGKNTGAEIFFSHFQTELGILRGTAVANVTDLIDAMEREEPQYTSGFSYSIHEPRQEVGHNLLKITAHSHQAKGEWSFVYGFQKNSRKEYDVRALGVDSGIPAIDLLLNTHTIEAEWESSHSDKRTLCLGLNGMIQDNANVFGTQRIPFIPNFTSLSGGPFAVAKLFLNRWTLDLGARYDYRNYNVAGYDYKNSLYKTNLQFSNASGTAGASLQLNKTQSVSLNISSAWRPPHVAELYSLGTHQSAAAIEYGLLLNDSTNEVMSIEDVSFEIEKALKSVVTFRFQKERIQVEATAYSNFILNYIYLTPVGITQNIRGTLPAFRYTQTDALFLGTDLSAIWQVSRQLKVTPKVALLRASDFRKKDYLVFIPSNRYELALRFEEPKEFRLKNFYLESRLKYTARQYRAPRTISAVEWLDAKANQVDPLEGTNKNFDFMNAPGGYFLLNLSAGFSMNSTRGRYDLRLSAENALNASYREYTNRFKYYADDLGRNFIISVKYIF